jgi:DNA-binding transcriptional regulator YiaG
LPDGKGKYLPLYNYLNRSKGNEIVISFPKLERILKSSLPYSARTTRAWWGNRKSRTSHSQAWLEAGYMVVAVDLENQEVRFQKLPIEPKPNRAGDSFIWDGDSIKALRYHMRLNQAQFAKELGVRQQTISEWETGIYRPTRSMSKFLAMIAERVNFLSK